MNPERFQKLRALFDQALSRPRDEREAFVLEVGGEDPELGDELRLLLEAHREDDVFLETVVDVRDTALQNGEMVGPYRVSGEIGRGGMGVVYLAEDTRLNRPVALKALSPELVSDPKQQQRFRREAMVAAALSHPSIATVYALEEVSGRFYIVSEYVPGPPLREEMASGSGMDPSRVIQIGLQLAGALAAAHERGVVHRDFKPENIVRVDDTRLKIVDFGLAIGPGALAGESRLTLSGTIVGTPTYMSPEQLRGEAVDFRSDIFSFGILLYELATGEHPFGSTTALGTSARILETPPAGIERLRQVCPGLDHIVLRCLEKLPGDRYPATRELVGDLVGLAPDTSRPESASRNAFAGGAASELHPRWWVVHQILVIALYTTMIVLVFVSNAPRSLGLLLGCGFLALGSGIWNGAMRVHLLFTLRFNRKEFGRELRRTVSLMRLVDLAFSLALVAAAGVILPDSQPWAAVFAAVAVCYAVVALIVEPTTVRSVFSAS